MVPLWRIAKSPNVRDNENGATHVEAHRGEARKTVRNAEGKSAEKHARDNLKAT
jgi:hypothetical protein